MSTAPSGSTAPQRILVIVTRRIGDVLLATPLIRSLKQAWPSARIDALVFAGTEGVLFGNTDIDQVHTVPARPRFTTHAALIARLFRRYDLALSLVPGDRPTLYAWLCGRHSIGLVIDAPGQRWKQWLLDQGVPVDTQNTHMVRVHLTLADALNVAPAANVVTAWRPEDATAVDALLGESGTSLAVLHPYPKFRYKMWRREGWVEVARWLHANGYRVVLTGSPDADERDYVAAIARQVPETLDLAGHLTLGGTAALLARAKIYVGPDTAITHLAAASGIPTIALFGPSDPVKWGPWPSGHQATANPWQRLGDQHNGNVHLLQGRAPCVPCKLEGCDRHTESDSECLLTLPAELVINHLKTISHGK